MNECYRILEHLMENKQQVRVVYTSGNTIIDVTGEIWLVWHINGYITMSISGAIVCILAIDSYSFQEEGLEILIKPGEKINLKFLK